MVHSLADRWPDVDAQPIRSLAIREIDDDPDIRHKYRPFILNDGDGQDDWIDLLELTTAIDMAEKDLQLTGQRLKVLVLYGSLRRR
jgi:arsenic resistance protein ArsH